MYSRNIKHLHTEWDSLISDIEQHTPRLIELVGLIGHEDPEMGHVYEKDLWKRALTLSAAHGNALSAEVLETDHHDFPRWFA